MEYVPDIDRLRQSESSVQAIDASRVALLKLIEHCHSTIAHASRALDQLDKERKQAMIRVAAMLDVLP